MGVYESCFPRGSSVSVRQVIAHRSAPVEVEVTGLVEAWERLPTGSWHAHGKNDRLWLTRIRLRKDNGEVTTIVSDRCTRLEVLGDASPV